jgi:uncharacterized protein YndB with AHSA1/START domain
VTALRIDRILPAPLERVWAALTEQAALAAWFWPTSFGTTVTADAHPGGRFRIAAADAPGGALAVEGEYTVVERPRLLVFTWRWDGDEEQTLVTITLSAVDGGTALTLTHEGFPDDATRDNHDTGWSDCLDRLPVWLTAATPATSPVARTREVG